MKVRHRSELKKWQHRKLRHLLQQFLIRQFRIQTNEKKQTNSSIDHLLSRDRDATVKDTSSHQQQPSKGLKAAKKVPSPRGNKKQGIRTKRTHQITDCPADFNPGYLSARVDSAGSSAACFCDRTISSSDRALSANDLSHQRQQQHPPTKFKRHSTKKRSTVDSPKF